MNSKILIPSVMALFATLFLSGCSRPAPQTDNSPVKVKTCIVKETTAEGGQSYPGTIEETSGSSLSFSTMGTVSTVSVHEGETVRKGQLIARLDETTLKSAYSTAEAMLIQAQDAYTRMKQLHDNNSLPEIQWVEVQSKLRQARSAEEIARKNLTDSRLYAPFSGVVSKKSVDDGQNVLPGQEVARLVRIDNVKISVPIPENEISSISVGDAVEVTVPALDNRRFPGKIVEKGIVANPISRTYEVKASVNNRDGSLMPGMLCSLYLDNGEATQRIIIPQNVIHPDENGNYFVWICDGGKARKRAVTIGSLSDLGVHIVSGLYIGDELIVEGYQKVSENTQVSR